MRLHLVSSNITTMMKSLISIFNNRRVAKYIVSSGGSVVWIDSWMRKAWLASVRLRSPSQKELEAVLTCEYLTSVDLGGPNVTDSFVKRLVQACPHLRYVGLEYSGITNFGLSELQSLQNLVFVTVPHSISDHSFTAFSKECPLVCVFLRKPDGVITLKNGEKTKIDSTWIEQAITELSREGIELR